MDGWRKQLLFILKKTEPTQADGHERLRLEKEIKRVRDEIADFKKKIKNIKRQ